MSPESDFALLYESLGDAAPAGLRSATHRLSLLVHVRLGQQEAEDYNQDRRACAKPVQGSPGVWGGVDETPCEGGGEEIAERVALLQDTGHQATSLLGKIFQCGSCGIAVQTAHGYTKQGPTGEELVIGVAEAGALSLDVSTVTIPAIVILVGGVQALEPCSRLLYFEEY